MMENFNLTEILKENSNNKDQMDLPPGFRFHPTDEELITHYLSNKVFDNNFCAKAIGEVDMNRIEPWELPKLAKMGEKEWYFFCVRDKKYPTGMRTNRATAGGYWKATGKDKEIFRRKLLVGMKKTLVFYRGRAPKGEKTNWVAHEFRLDGKSNQILHKSSKNEWVICRVFHKFSGGNSGSSSSLPPLMNFPAPATAKPVISEQIPVPCFSNSINNQQKIMFNNLRYNSDFNFTSNFDHRRFGSFSTGGQLPENSAFPATNQAILKGLIDDNNYGEKMKLEREMITGSQETGLSTEMNMEVSSVMRNLEMGKKRFEDHQETPAIDMDCLWNY